VHGSRALLILAWLTASAASQEDAAARLLAELKAGGAARRSAALAELAKGAATPAVLAAVALTLGDNEPQVRRDAVAALLALRRDLASVREQLMAIVAVRDTYTITGMAHFGIPPAIRIDASRLVNALHSDQSQARAWAVRESCRQQATDHVVAILALATDLDADVRAAVAGSVGTLGWTDAIRSAVERAMQDSEPTVRRAAAATLGGHDEAATVAALRGAIQDPDDAVRVAVIHSLGRCGKAAAAAASDLTASLRDRHAAVRAAALEALAQLKVADARAVRETIRCLDDEDRSVVAGGLHAVAVQARAASATMPRLRILVHDENDEVRLAALDAIWAVADESQRGEAVLLFVDALLDGARQVRAAALPRLEQFVDRLQ
jgi:HEAT repeat protein